MKRAERCSVLDRTIDSSGVVWKGVPLKSILMDAFQARWQQIEGPSWLETDCFDISATSPEGAIRNQLPAMLRALLAEKFKLLAHNEDRMLSGHALVVDKDGPKFNQDVPMVNFIGGKWLFGDDAITGKVLKSAVCMYAMSPDGHFIIDRLPGHPNVVVGCGFSGHGFKFTSAVGEHLVNLAYDSATKPLGIFELDRFAAAAI